MLMLKFQFWCFSYNEFWVYCVVVNKPRDLYMLGKSSGYRACMALPKIYFIGYTYAEKLVYLKFRFSSASFLATLLGFPWSGIISLETRDIVYGTVLALPEWNHRFNLLHYLFSWVNFSHFFSFGFGIFGRNVMWYILSIPLHTEAFDMILSYYRQVRNFFFVHGLNPGPCMCEM